MLVLSRKVNEAVVLDGGRIRISVVEIDRGKIRLGIEAPSNVVIDREEIHLKKIKSNDTEPKEHEITS